MDQLLWTIFVLCICASEKKLKKELKQILTTFCVQQKYNIYLTRYNIANNIYIIIIFIYVIIST